METRAEKLRFVFSQRSATRLKRMQRFQEKPVNTAFVAPARQ